MKKMLKLLDSVTSYNSFCEIKTLEVVNGNQTDLYFRIIQKNSGSCEDCNNTRFLPSSSATLQLIFENLDEALQITRYATMVYPNDDRSIFKVTLLNTDKISGSVKAILTDGGISETILLDGRIKVSSTDSSRFHC